MDTVRHLYSCAMDVDWQSHAPIVVAIVVCYLLYKWWTRPHLPPGPPASTTMFGGSGSIPSHTEMQEMSKQYGGIFSIRYCRRLVVVLNSYKEFKAGIVRKRTDFSGRPATWISNNSELKDAIFSHVMTILADDWKRNRKFLQKFLNCSVCPGSNSETVIQKELEKLCVSIDGTGKADCPEVWDHIELLITKIILKLVIGFSPDHNDPRLLRLHSHLLKWSQLIFDTWRVDLALLPCSISKTKKQQLMDLTGKIKSLVLNHIDESRQQSKEHLQKDLTHAYMTRHQKLDIDQLFGILFSCFTDSFQVLPVALKWILLYVTYYPEVQQKLHAEVQKVTSGSHMTSLDDYDVMVYTNAVIMESLRLASVVPLTYPHIAVWDSMVHDYDIPQSTVVYGNIYAMHRDPELWPDPEKFTPERHIDNNGSLVNKKEWLPFSEGWRSCPAGDFSTRFLFLTLTSLIQKYKLEFSGQKPSLEATEGAIRRPPNFNLSFIPRKI